MPSPTQLSQIKALQKQLGLSQQLELSKDKAAELAEVRKNINLLKRDIEQTGRPLQEARGRVMAAENNLPTHVALRKLEAELANIERGQAIIPDGKTVKEYTEDVKKAIKTATIAFQAERDSAQGTQYREALASKRKVEGELKEQLEEKNSRLRELEEERYRLDVPQLRLDLWSKAHSMATDLIKNEIRDTGINVCDDRDITVLVAQAVTYSSVKLGINPTTPANKSTLKAACRARGWVSSDGREHGTLATLPGKNGHEGLTMSMVHDNVVETYTSVLLKEAQKQGITVPMQAESDTRSRKGAVVNRPKKMS